MRRWRRSGPRTVIWAAASWSGQHAVARLPENYRAAMTAFPRAPMMIVNVVLDNWRAFHQLGFTAASWRGGFGFTANLRAPVGGVVSKLSCPSPLPDETGTRFHHELVGIHPFPNGSGRHAWEMADQLLRVLGRPACRSRIGLPH